MIPVNKEYPVFEANQVLTATHLNTLEKYLDEQNRLTRATLHGIGIVCGLEVSTNDTRTKLTISKGYGITSEGYPGIVGNEDFVADKYQVFTVNDEYSLLWANQMNKYDLWELLDVKHDDYKEGKALTSTILEGKVVLLFVELLEKDLKNCSATSCDDLGLKVQVKTRMLLISETDLTKLNAEIVANTAKENASGDFAPNLTARLDLPDIQLPRLDVPASNMIDALSLFDAYKYVLSAPVSFQMKTKFLLTTIGESLKTKSLVTATNDLLKTKSVFIAIGVALDACFHAFSPMLQALGSTFADRLIRIEGYYNSDSSQKNINIIFSQYYYDFLGDLIEAYDEFRWQAVEFMALCNPPQTIFPRHLELGETGSGNFAGKKVHRHYFRPSPALSDEKKGKELQMLFKRIDLLVNQFIAAHDSLVSIPQPASSNDTIDTTVKITPSSLGNIALSDKAIPYYYTLTEQLQNAWNFIKTSRGRAAQNLGYYVNSSANKNALAFDLERYNFFRIEGHLGLDWRKTAQNLLDKIRKYRLPFDVVALNAYPATVSADVLADPLMSHCINDDLEIIYDAWSKELACLMRNQVSKLTDFTLVAKKASAATLVEKTASPIRKTVASEKTAKQKFNLDSAIVIEENTFGKVYSNALKAKEETPSVDLKQTFNTLLLKEKEEFGKISMEEYNTVIGNRLDMMTSMMNFADTLPTQASEMNYAGINNNYKTLQDAALKYRNDISRYDTSRENAILSEEQKQAILTDLDQLLSNCLMDRLEALNEELQQRKKEVDELIFFSKYIQKHPGIAHKAGVPAGGTFILLFQEIPTGSGAVEVKTDSRYTIPERVVIADFFLPYRCCSDCPPVQFVIPAARPKFTMQQECPGDDGYAWVNLLFTYRVPPCEVKIDNLNYVPLVDDRIRLKVGSHLVTVMDAEGGVSLVHSIQVRPRFTVNVNAEDTKFDVESKTCTTKLTITDAQLPITIDGVEVTATPQGTNINIVTVSYESTKTIEVGDASPCPAQVVKLCIPVMFTMQQECPNSDGYAMVNFEFTYGVAPFEIKIGETDYVPLVNNSVELQVGTYEIIVKDVNGCVSEAQSIQVRPRFTVSAENPVCDETNETYTVRLLVSNALLPITIDGEKVDSAAQDANVQSVIVGPYKSGESATVKIGDASDCPPETLTLKHNCCELPCNGIALRRGYRFTLPEPDPKLIITQLDFWLEYPQGNKIYLSEKMKEIILQGGEVVNKINELIDHITAVHGWLKFYKESPSGENVSFGLDTWWLEYFECLESKFGFDIKWTYQAITYLPNSVTVSVNPDYSMVKIANKDDTFTNVTIPAFDGFIIDKCNPGSQEEPLCKEPDLKLVTSAKVDGSTVMLVSDTGGIDKAVAFLWEVPGSVEQMANGNKATFTFSTIDDFEKPYRLTAFTERGCRKSIDGSFRLKG